MRKCISCGTPPQPYYKNDKNSLTQDHAAIFRDTQFAAGIRIKDEFVVPQIGEDVQVCSKELVNVLVGAYVWSPAYGYLKIDHWDSCTGKMGLLNEGIEGSAIPGTVVSEGSLFAVTARPCCADQDNFQLFPFLAEDYVIPAVNGSVTLAVTSTFGLIEGTIVRIGSNLYFLDQINSSLQIVVTNQGAGGTPGATVQARDVNGELQYLITQAVTSACSAAGNDTVRLIGCVGSTQAILTGDYAGQVPVLQDASTEEVEFRLLDTEERLCTFLTNTLNVLAATASYTIDVADESIFSIGQVLQIDFGSLRWEITDNTTPNELDITCTTGLPGSNFAVAAGSTVCLELTTDLLEQEIIDLGASVAADIATLEGQIISGWLPLSAAGTYISASSFSVVGDVTASLKIGQKFKLLKAATPLYGNIKSFSFGAGITTIVIIVNTDHVLSAAAFTEVKVSNENPVDFPAFFNYDINATGFTGSPTVAGNYWVKDSNISGVAFAIGTSNATSFTVKLPVEGEGFTVYGGAQVYEGIDNNVPLTTVGTVGISGTTATLHPTQNSASVWTNTSTKQGIVRFSYIIDQ